MTTLHEHMLQVTHHHTLKLIHPTCHIIHIITCLQSHAMELANHNPPHTQCVRVEECYWLPPLCVISMTFHKSSARNSMHSLHSNIKFLKFLYFVGSKTPYNFPPPKRNCLQQFEGPSPQRSTISLFLLQSHNRIQSVIPLDTFKS